MSTDHSGDQSTGLPGIPGAPQQLLARVAAHAALWAGTHRGRRDD
ncbi:hypothetical protein ACFPKZ_07050 [Streptosporangium amethystogenes subsp. fukuiense]